MFCIKYSIYQSTVVSKCYGTVVSWNETNLHLRKTSNPRLQVGVNGQTIKLLLLIIMLAKNCSL